jgi:hypothetical protein
MKEASRSRGCQVRLRIASHLTCTRVYPELQWVQPHVLFSGRQAVSRKAKVVNIAKAWSRAPHRIYAACRRRSVANLVYCCATKGHQEHSEAPPSDDALREYEAVTSTPEHDTNDAVRRELAENRFKAVRERVATLEQKLQHGEAIRRVLLAEQLLKALRNPELYAKLEAVGRRHAAEQETPSSASSDSKATASAAMSSAVAGAAATELEQPTDVDAGRTPSVAASDERIMALARIIQQTQGLLEALSQWKHLPDSVLAKAKEFRKELGQVLLETDLETVLTTGGSVSSAGTPSSETSSPAARDFFNRAVRALRGRSSGKPAVTDEELESILSAAAQMRRTSALKAEMDRIVTAEAAAAMVEAQRARDEKSAKNTGATYTQASARHAQHLLERCRLKGHELRSWLKHFVSDTWQRLNGVPSPSQGSSEMSETAIAPAPVMPFRQRQALIFKHTLEDLKPLERKLQELSKEREMRLRREGPLGKLIHIRDLRALDDQVNALRRQISVRVLESEMERIYLYLDAELDASTLFFSRPINDEQEEMLLIAEYGLLARRLAEIQVLVDVGEAVLIEDDELADLASDIQFLKSRLGIGEDDAYMNLGSVVLDWSRIRQYLAEMSQKAKEGGEFYWRGVRLLGGDIMYSLRLIQRAAAGYTLTPREVRTIRRTGRDILTLVPFGILLALPLTPVGHVMVFSFIQRYFPSFFPSTFTDKRQELMRRYESLMQQISSLEKDSATEEAEKVSLLARAAPEETHLASDDDDNDIDAGTSYVDNENDIDKRSSALGNSAGERLASRRSRGVEFPRK